MYNIRRGERFLAVVRDIEGRKLATYEQPVYAITPDGHFAYSLNFARLHNHRPGYGYAGGTDPWADDLHPGDDGIYRLNLSTGFTRHYFGHWLLASGYWPAIRNR